MRKTIIATMENNRQVVKGHIKQSQKEIGTSQEEKKDENYTIKNVLALGNHLSIVICIHVQLFLDPV